MENRLVYCPVCGNELIERHEGGRVRPACDNCGYVHYLNPVPGVGLLIEKEGGVVLIKRGSPPHKDEWTLPSGFVEADESAEEAAIREAYEETGLKVEIIELAGINSFPEGPLISGIMIFYRVKPISGELQAGDDAVDAKVFQPEDMPILPFRTHREMMALWLNDFQSKATVNEADDNETSFYIRRSEPRDVEEIKALLALIPSNRSLSEAQWREVDQRIRELPSIEVFVAVTKQSTPTIIGVISLSIVRGLTEGRGFINDVAVLPAFQRRGIGAALLEAVYRRAGQLNLTSLMVNTQRATDNIRAFYAASGFSEDIVLRVKLR